MGENGARSEERGKAETRLRDAQRAVDKARRELGRAINERGRVVAEARDDQRMSLREIARALETDEAHFNTSRVNAILAAGFAA